jgi:hypothetical protein
VSEDEGWMGGGVRPRVWMGGYPPLYTFRGWQIEVMSYTYVGWDGKDL